uniref:Ribonucleotide reductase large subunit domain-containing protein n=1 Tax=viral metagenome TaxID=1070528 RepID=A0A6C0BMG1_9ZZZZ
MDSIINNMLHDLSGITHKEIEDIITSSSIEERALTMGSDSYDRDRSLLAGRLIIYDVERQCPQTVRGYVDAMNLRLSDDIAQYMLEHAHTIESVTKDSKRFKHDWFSASSLVRNYLSRPRYNSDIVETEAMMNWRIAVQHYYTRGINRIVQCWHELNEKLYSVASPTAFNAGMKNAQMSSCFLVCPDDSIGGWKGLISSIMDISSNSGGTGFDVSGIRHSEIGLTGFSKGPIPLLKVCDEATKTVDQRGKRTGAGMANMTLHHIDVENYINLTLKTGDHTQRVHTLKTCLWSSWLFWDRVFKNGEWTLFCPNYTKDLLDLSGAPFIERYVRYEQDPSIPSYARKTIKARELLKKIATNVSKSSLPYMMNGCSSNFKSNQRNLGNIRTTNLCTEIIEYSSPEETAVCNLSSIRLSAFVKKGKFNFHRLGEVSRSVTENLNMIIDHNWLPQEGMRRSNKRHRPVGLGCSGLADAFHKLDLCFDSEQARDMNKKIFACMYFNAMAESVRLAIEDGPYESFQGSPLSEGKFQFDLWADELKEMKRLGLRVIDNPEDDIPVDPSEWNQQPITLNGDLIQPTWDDLRRCVMKYGVRNSLLIAIAPTATSSQATSSSECVEPHQSNMYTRKLISGSYTVVNRFMVKDLKKIGAWEYVVTELMQAYNGSIAKLHLLIRDRLDLFPNFNGDWDRLTYLQRKYRTMWELSQKELLKMTADRMRYICQSQSTNIYIASPTIEQIEAIYTYTAMLRLKTQAYYIRTQPAVQTMKATLGVDIMKFVESQGDDVDAVKTQEAPTITKDISGKKFICTDDVCTACSS